MNAPAPATPETTLDGPALDAPAPAPRGERSPLRAAALKVTGRVARVVAGVFQVGEDDASARVRELLSEHEGSPGRVVRAGGEARCSYASGVFTFHLDPAQSCVVSVDVDVAAALASGLGAELDPSAVYLTRSVVEHMGKFLGVDDAGARSHLRVLLAAAASGPVLPVVDVGHGPSRRYPVGCSVLVLSPLHDVLTAVRPLRDEHDRAAAEANPLPLAPETLHVTGGVLEHAGAALGLTGPDGAEADPALVRAALAGLLDPYAGTLPVVRGGVRVYERDGVVVHLSVSNRRVVFVGAAPAAPVLDVTGVTFPGPAARDAGHALGLPRDAAVEAVLEALEVWDGKAAPLVASLKGEPFAPVFPVTVDGADLNVTFRSDVSRVLRVRRPAEACAAAAA